MNDKGALAAALQASGGFSWVINIKGNIGVLTAFKVVLQN
jgi:hypothetical protein